MENKKSKVTAIAENVRQWKDLFYHTITFENGDSGDYGSKSATCTKFKQGEESEYTLETKVHGNYTNKIIKPAQAQSSYEKGEKKPFNQKIIVAQSSYERAVQLAVISKMPMDLEELDKTALHIYNKVCQLGGISEGN